MRVLRGQTRLVYPRKERTRESAGGRQEKREIYQELRPKNPEKHDAVGVRSESFQTLGSCTEVI